jgi:aspartate/methionine/tyrosine aminotransferase
VKPANQILSGYGTTIFTVMSALAVEHKAVNLGQGFPDGNGPADVRRVAAEALEAPPNQYPPMMGIPELRQAVAAHNKRFYGLDVDWQTEVMVTSGATEALTDCLLAWLNPGDEVVLLEPLYDSYLPIIRLAGAIPRLVRLTPPDWRLPREEVAAAFGPRTKLLMLNSPMNPTGKVFDDDELAFLAELCVRHDVVAVCDEVYEHLTFDGRRHRPLMTFPGMRERSLRIGSAGKTFSLTGWKIGYITGAPSVLGVVAKAHQFVTFTSAPNLQRAVAYGLGKDDSYFNTLSAELAAKRDRLRAGLEEVGFATASCEGTYFINADFRPLGFAGDDEAFCRHITEQAGVTAVPVSAFYSDGAIRHLARFCFCKDDATLDEALRRLKAHFRK